MFLSAPALALVCSGGCPPACHVADGVRGRNAQTSPRDDRRQSRQPPREPSGQSGSNRRHQHTKLNRDHRRIPSRPTRPFYALQRGIVP
jgi:hypothetical protein